MKYIWNRLCEGSTWGSIAFLLPAAYVFWPTPFAWISLGAGVLGVILPIKMRRKKP